MNVTEKYEMFQELKLGFQARAHAKRYVTSHKFLACEVREKSSIIEHVLRLCECYNCLNRVGLSLPDEIVMVLQITATKLLELRDEV